MLTPMDSLLWGFDPDTGVLLIGMESALKQLALEIHDFEPDDGVYMGDTPGLTVLECLGLPPELAAFAHTTPHRLGLDVTEFDRDDLPAILATAQGLGLAVREDQQAMDVCRYDV